MTEPVVLLLSGPNLGLLGEREPSVYGTATLADHVRRAEGAARRQGFLLEHVQSEHEGDLVAAVHGARGRVAAIVVNAGALSHYGWSLHDALAAFDGKIVELHLSHPGGAGAVASHVGHRAGRGRRDRRFRGARLRAGGRGRGATRQRGEGVGMAVEVVRDVGATGGGGAPGDGRAGTARRACGSASTQSASAGSSSPRSPTSAT